MAIAGIADITYSMGQSTDPIVDFINTKFNGVLTATHDEDSDNNTIDIHITDANNHEIIDLLVYNGSSSAKVLIYNHSGNATTYSLSSSNTAHWGIYTCSHGLLLRCVNNLSVEMWAYITINDDGTVIYGGSPSKSTGTSPTEFTTHIWALSPYTTTATSRIAGSTSLLNLVYNGDFGVVSISQYGYFALYNQYPYTIGVINLNDALYISNGWFMIRD